jgi:hypothetical protein
MKTFSALLLSALLTLALTSGCNRSGAAPKPVSPEAASQSLRSTFASAPSSIRDSAVQAAEAIQRHDTTAAFITVYDLSSRPDLTVEQRKVAGQSLATLLTGLRTSAEAGNAQAKRALDLYRAGK